MRGVEKFTQNAIDAVRATQRFAREVRSREIGVEHLFVGLLMVEPGVASKVLASEKVDFAGTIGRVKMLLAKWPLAAIGVEAKLGDPFKKAVNRAFAIANSMKHVYVGTEHLLLAVLEQTDQELVRQLRSAGITLEKIKRKVGSFVQYPEGVLAESREKRSSSILDFLATNLTELARKGKLDPVIGRDTEIERLINILARRTKNNPIIVGESGVGKTAIVEGLAQRIAQDEVSSLLHGYEIWSLDTAAILAGSQMRGEVEGKLLALIEEVSHRSNVILFIDEIHNLIGANAGGGGMSVGSVLKPALAKGRLNCIGATTTEEYSNQFEKDPALERRFQPVFVDELTVDATVEILKGLKPVYESFHGVKIDDEALVQAAKLSKRYITDRRLPDKAVDLIDEASARSRVGKLKLSPKYRDLLSRLRKQYLEKEKLVDDGDFDKAAVARKEQEKLLRVLSSYRKTQKREWKKKPRVVVTENIREVVSDWTGIPVETLSSSEAKTLLSLSKRLQERIVGQENAIQAVVSAVKRARTGVAEENRPLASLLFLGPTGVGKTELAKQLAKQLFGDLDSFIQLDMSEYMEAHSVSKLIGSPPGYVGFDQGGQLTQQIWRRPYSVVLFDEVEKAHVDVLNVLLQVLEEGHLTDGRGRRVSFKNAVIIMTSNIGAEEIGENEEIGFKLSGKKAVNEKVVEEAYEDMQEKIMANLKESFRPEFINRIDEVVIFRTLSLDEIKKIVKIQLEDLNDRLKDTGVRVEIGAKLLGEIAETGYNETYGARPIKRQIQELVEAPLADFLLRNKLGSRAKTAQVVKLDFENGKVSVKHGRH